MTSYAVFLGRWRQRTLVQPNWHLITRNECSILARTLALSFSTCSFQLAPGRVLLRAPLAQTHGHLPVDINALPLRPFVFALVACNAKHHRLLAVQQPMTLLHIIDFSCRCDDALELPRTSTEANVGLRPEVRLIALLGLVRLTAPLYVFVVGRTRRCAQVGLHHGACIEHKAFVSQRAIDGGHNLQHQPEPFKQMTKSQGGALVGRAAYVSAKLGEIAVERCIAQGFFCGQIAHAAPQLREVNAQHLLHCKGRAPNLARRRMRRVQPHKLCTGNHQVHLIKKFALARALGGQIELGGGKTLLFQTGLTPDQVNQMTSAEYP